MPSQLTFSQIYPLMKASIKVGHTPALLGDPGIGKSSLIEDLAREFKTKVFTLPINQLADRADLTGVRMVQNEKTGTWSQKAFPHFKIMEAVEYAEDNPDETPLLFMDEFNRASSDITSAVLSLQTERAIGSIKFPDNLKLIVAGNDKGNVISLDQASISRFVVYHVKPDVDTFLKVQELNPFITDVLARYPDDLVAINSAANKIMVEDDEDDEDNENDALSMFGLDDEQSFAQITRPRTITYLSQWLDAMGIDKSASEAEREVLSGLYTDMSEDDNNNVLRAGIEAHVGQTTFADHVYEDIQTHLNSMLSAGTTANKPLLSALRPDQDVINKLSRAQDMSEIETLIDEMNQSEVTNAIVWMTETVNTTEINNNNSVQAFMKNAPHKLDQLDGDAIKNLMKVLPDSNRTSAVAVKALLETTADVMTQWRGMIESVVETN